MPESWPPASLSDLSDLVLSLPPDIASSLADLVLGLPALAAHRGRRQTQVVRYEHLVARPDEEIRRVIARLGYDPMGIASAIWSSRNIFGPVASGIEKSSRERQSMTAQSTLGKLNCAFKGCKH
ncbi:hypothetical protein [Bradyrhizobium sp. RDI18]|uniref:hypothetical protein n=1 Tax=Bradyrhizobium sp. RDI18 TaxID=3367400 RepID=UPI00372162E8